MSRRPGHWWVPQTEGESESDREFRKEREKYWQGVLEKHGPLGCALRMLFSLFATLLAGFVLIILIAALVRGCSS